LRHAGTSKITQSRQLSSRTFPESAVQGHCVFSSRSGSRHQPWCEILFQSIGHPVPARTTAPQVRWPAFRAPVRGPHPGSCDREIYRTCRPYERGIDCGPRNYGCLVSPYSIRRDRGFVLNARRCGRGPRSSRLRSADLPALGGCKDFSARRFIPPRDAEAAGSKQRVGHPPAPLGDPYPRVLLPGCTNRLSALGNAQKIRPLGVSMALVKLVALPIAKLPSADGARCPPMISTEAF